MATAGGASARAFAAENKSCAQRHGIHGTFVTEHGSLTVADQLEQVLEMTAEDAEALDCAEAGDCRRIITRGTSADAQLAAFRACSSGQAFDAVIQWIARATLEYRLQN